MLFLGGKDSDDGRAMAVDRDGNCYVQGNTSSVDFPLHNPFQGVLAGGNDSFVTKIDPSGSNLVYSTFLGGSSSEDNTLASGGIAVDALGRAFLTASTASLDFPLRDPLQASRIGENAYLTQFNSDGSDIVFSTYFGGSVNDTPMGLAIDGSGSVVMAGYTLSHDFPLLDLFQSSFGGTASAFIARFDCSPDPVPPDQGNRLLATRRGADVALSYPAAPATLWRLFRDTDKGQLATTALVPDAGAPTFIDAGGLPRPPALAFYRVRGLSPCSWSLGP